MGSEDEYVAAATAKFEQQQYIIGIATTCAIQEHCSEIPKIPLLKCSCDTVHCPNEKEFLNLQTWSSFKNLFIHWSKRLQIFPKIPFASQKN